MSIVTALSLIGCGLRNQPLEGTVPNSEAGTEVLPSCGGDEPITTLTDEYDAEKAHAAAMDFAVRLLQYAHMGEMIPGCSSAKNVLVSPLSVYLALGMLENGAKSETLAQIEESVGLNVGQMNSFAREYLDNISEELKIANSIWYTDHARFTLENNFGAINKDYYNADLYQRPFDKTTVKEINDWIEEKTDGTIKEMLDDIPADALMYLINALVFEAEWDEKYDEGQIREGIFTIDKDLEQKVDMMYSEEMYYLEDEHATGFLKYYEGKDYAFAALLPKEGMSVFPYLNGLTGEHLQNMLENPKEVHVNAAIPEFTTEYKAELKDILQEMGIVDAFDEKKADLTGLGTSEAGNIFVSRVLHKTFIEVTPVGTKAGAATMVEVKDECAILYEESKDVILDRPFIYMIIDCESNQPIFMGIVNHVEPGKCRELCGYPTEDEF